MSEKNVDFNRAMRRIVNPSVFDGFVKEMDITEVPLKYMEKVAVYYDNGSVIELEKNDIKSPFPIKRHGDPEKLIEAFSHMKEVKVFIDIDQLEQDVNVSLNYLFADS